MATNQYDAVSRRIADAYSNRQALAGLANQKSAANQAHTQAMYGLGTSRRASNAAAATAQYGAATQRQLGQYGAESQRRAGDQSYDLGLRASYTNQYGAESQRRAGDKAHKRGMYDLDTQRQLGLRGADTDAYRAESERLANNAFFFTPKGKMYSNQAFQAAAAAQSNKDVAAMGALGTLGAANQNALGQYGVSRNAALANQSVAAANAYGQMQNSYLNTLGQLGHIGASLAAAGLGAGAQSGSASQFASMGGRSSGGGFGGGFMADGPEGEIASGSYGGGGIFGGMLGGAMSGSTATRGASPDERMGMMNQGYGWLDQVLSSVRDPRGQAALLANEASRQFDANRAGVMDSSITRSLNSGLATGYNAVSNLYGQADMGFNTQFAGQRVADANAGYARAAPMVDPMQNFAAKQAAESGDYYAQQAGRRPLSWGPRRLN